MKMSKKEKQETKTGKKKIKTWQIVTAVFAVILLALLVNIVKQSMGAAAAGTPVTTVQVLKGDITQTVDTSGSVESEESKTYFAQVGATIGELHVKAGDSVKTGDLLLSYDTADLEQALKQTELEAQVSTYGADITVASVDHAQQKAAQAQTDYDDSLKYIAHYTECVGQLTDQLNKANALQADEAALQAEIKELTAKVEKDDTDQESAKVLKKKTKELEKIEKKLADYDVSNLQSALETCQGDLAEYKALKEQYPTAGLQKKQQAVVKESAQLTEDRAKTDLEKAKAGVTADFNGIVTNVAAVQGQTTVEGAELFTIQNADALKVSLAVSKYDIEKLAIGQKADITINGKSYTGEVSNISKVASTNNAGAVVINTDIHIDNPDDNIVLGVEAKVSIKTAEEKNVLLVPIAAVNYASDGVFCYVAENGVLVRKEVETGISSDEYVQILSGLSEGDAVITDVTGDMTEGMAVTAVSADEADAQNAKRAE
jgi:HlyD family secretion protein